MGKHISWVHGNAVRAESPDRLEPGDQNFGWGFDVNIKSGQACWFHIPLAVPAVVGDAPAKLSRVFLLFNLEGNSQLRSVHVYDGARLLQEFNNINLSGDFTLKIVPGNTFTLRTPHTVRRGIGLSFLVQGSAFQGPDATPNRMIIPAAGAEFITHQPFLATIADAFSDLTRRGP
jgi:hypothetical protein